MTSFREVNRAKFELTNVITYGVVGDKHNCYYVPIELNYETAKKIRELVRYYNTESPLHDGSNNICLRSKNLSVKQENDLYNKGELYIDIDFELYGVMTCIGTSILLFRIMKLRKTETLPGTMYDAFYPED